jgi:hypothetical protein
VEVWFTHKGELFQTTRTISATPAVGRASLEALFTGPSRVEIDAGIGTRVEDGTTIGSLTIDGGVATVTLSSHAESDPLSDAQVVYTLTQFPTVQRVQINEQEGGPLSRDDLAGELPAILVETPVFGAEVSSPITISGTADVFEAVVSMKILDADGKRIAHAVVNASCGSGCRGDFTKDVPYSVSSDQLGTVVVFEVSAEDGHAINVQRLPVTLTA